MKFKQSWVLSTATAALIVVGVASPAPADPEPVIATAASPALTAALDNLLGDPRFTGSQVGLRVADANTGEVLYDRNGTNRLLPASNMKLVTAASALHTLGADYRFHTDVYAGGRSSGGKLRGDLYLKGFGDPTTLDSDYRSLAKQVARAGINRIDGNLVVDDSFFDSVRLGPFWSWDDEPYYYSAQTSALTVAPNTDYDSGTVIVEARPGAVGAPVRLSTVPATGVLRFEGAATTGAPGSANTLSVEREHGSNVVRVRGSVPADAPVGQKWVTVWEPTQYAADVFRRQLAAEGVRLAGKVTIGTVPSGARMLARDTSMTVGELMVPFMKLSNNLHAEALVKAMGQKDSQAGTWKAGVAAMKKYLTSAGVDPTVLQLTDGSGLSRADYLTPDALTRLLVAAKKAPWSDAFDHSLPVAGNQDRTVGGTLRSRMVGTPAANNVRAKTGSMTGVTALSGYVTTADGRELVFSMISNNYLQTPRPVEDAVAITLATFTADASAIKIVVPQRRSAPTAVSPHADREWCELKSC